MNQELCTTTGDLEVRCTIQPTMDHMMVMVPGTCHTEAHFEGMVPHLNKAGISTARLTYYPKHNWVPLREYIKGTRQLLRTLQRTASHEVGSVTGHSIGGMFTRMAMAEDETVEHPRIELATVPPRRASKSIREAAIEAPGLFIKSVINVRSAMKDPENMRYLFFTENAPEDMVARAAEQTIAFSRLAYLGLLLHTDDLEALRAVNEPAYVIAATRDRLFGLDRHEEYRNAMQDKDVTFDRMDGAHNFFIEEPAQTVDTMLEWMQSKNLI